MKNNIKKGLGSLALVLVLSGCGSNAPKEEAKDKGAEQAQEMAVPEGQMPEGAQITKDTTTEIEDVDPSQRPSNLGKFEATDQEGKKFTNEDLGKYDATVINLWFTGCSACIQEMPELNKLADEFKKDEKVNFVSLCTDSEYDDSTKAAYKRIIEENKPTYQALGVKQEGDIKKFIDNIFAYPTTIVVDKNGNVIGDDVVGAITSKDQQDKLMKNIEAAKEASNK